MEQFGSVAPRSTKRKAKNNKDQPQPKRSNTRVDPTLRHFVAPSSSTSLATANMHPCVKLLPPIIILEKSCWPRISKKFKMACIRQTYGRSTKDGIVVQPKDFITHQRLTRLLSLMKVIFNIAQDLKVMIRGLPVELNCESIFEELKSQRLLVREVHRIYHPILGSPNKLVLIVLDQSPEGEWIFKLNAVCGISNITFEVPRNLGQCQRCDFASYSERISQDSSQKTTMSSQNSSVNLQEPVTARQTSSTPLHVPDQGPELLLASSTDLQMLDIRPQTSSSMDYQTPECDSDMPSAMVNNTTDESDRIPALWSNLRALFDLIDPKNLQEIPDFINKLKANPKNRFAVVAQNRGLIDRLHKFQL